MRWLFTATGRLNAPDETHTWFLYIYVIFSPSYHQLFFGNHMITRTRGPLTSSFRAISLKWECNTTSCLRYRPPVLSMNDIQYDNTHINKAQMEKRKKTKQLRARAGLAQEKKWPKGNKNNEMSSATFLITPLNNLPNHREGKKNVSSHSIFRHKSITYILKVERWINEATLKYRS